VPAPALPQSPSPLRTLDLRLTPEQALAAWPAAEPLAALVSAGESPHARWTILARPGQGTAFNPTSPDEARAVLHELVDVTSTPAADEGPPFRAGRFLALSYDLGRVLEPAVGPAPHPLDIAHIHALDCDDALIHDHAHARWWSVGNPPALAHDQPRAAFALSAPTPDQPARAYTAAVERILEYIRAGDVYQVNLAHRLTSTFRGCPRALFLSLLRSASPWYGAYLETAGGVIASASPELFLSYDPTTRTLTTRPMKGTRPFSHAADLEHSEKDAAELNMITDLMRNDLGRVCALGSVRVQTRRALERHNTLAQTTSTVTGTLRAGLTLADALAATFPGGSVTGCPKIRAMQIIDELEPSPRGFYCGAIGYVSATGHASFSIAIRTAIIRAGTLHYSTGAGITIDSDPQAEYQETLDKAAILHRL
jgi:para-aminobenzoate synthetase component 1